MSSAVSDYLALREAIELCGPRMIAGWTGDEGRAPSGRELAAQRTEILEWSDEAILKDAEETRTNREQRIEQERTADDLTRTSVNDALDKLRAKIASTEDVEQRANLEKALARLEKPPLTDARAPSTQDLANDHRHFLLDELETFQAPALAKRARRDAVHDRLRRAVADGALRHYARLALAGSPLGIIERLQAEVFPEFGETCVALPWGPLAQVVFLREDLDRVFPSRANQTEPIDPLDQPGQGRPGNRYKAIYELRQLQKTGILPDKWQPTCALVAKRLSEKWEPNDTQPPPVASTLQRDDDLKEYWEGLKSGRGN